MAAAEPHSRAEALALIDPAVEAYLASGCPLRLGLAKSEAERQAVYRLRYDVVMSRGWAGPDDLPESLERDEYDDTALHIVAWDGEALVGTARLILPSSDRRLPVENLLSERIPPAGQVVEWGRVIVARPDRSLERRVLWGFLARCWFETRQHGYSEISGILSRSMIRLYRWMGLIFTVLGPPHLFWKEERFPVRFDTIASAPAVVRHLGDLTERPA